MQKALDEKNKTLLELENRLEEMALNEREKDTEIANLLKKLKRMTQKIENGKVRISYLYQNI